MATLPAIPQFIEFEAKHYDYAMVAIASHGDQKYGDFNYGYHLAMVEFYVCEYGFAEHNFRAASWLHDIVEDTETTIAEVGQFFGADIASLVWACTGEGLTRKQRNESIYKKLVETPDAAVIKCADRFANVLFSVKTKNKEKLAMYVKEWPDFRAVILPLMVGVGDSRKSYFFNVLDDLMEKSKGFINDKPSKDSE